MRVFFKRFSVIAGFGLLVLLLASGILLTRRQVAVQVGAQARVAHTREVLFNLETTESLLKDAETGQRGFLLTGDAHYLEPYKTATSLITPQLDGLAHLVADNARQVESAARLRSLADEKLSELQQTVDLDRAGKHDQARALVLSDRGKTLMDQIRAVIGSMRSEEQRIEAIRRARYATSIRFTNGSLYLMGSIGIAGLCFLALFILRDINSRDRHYREIRAQEERFRVTLTSIGDGVIATDRDGRVTFLNPVAERLMGRTMREAVGHPVEAVFPIFNEYTGLPPENPVQKVINEGRIVGLANHTVLVHTDGTRTPIEDSAAPIHDDQHKLIGVVLVFRDATSDRKSQDLIRRAEKLSAAARLAATVAHEINNPLEAVSNLIYLAKLSSQASSAQVEHLTLAEHELARVAHITRQTLGFYRESRERQPLDLAPVLDSVVGLYSNKLESKRITIERNYEASPRVLGTAGELRQALANLVSNAIDAVDHDGTIALTIRPSHAAEEIAAEILIEDDGPGIAPENLARIFEPFFTTKKDVGTGLGLYITREIVERHGGAVDVIPSSNNGNSGATFVLRLPCAPGEDAMEPSLITRNHVA
ncbi:MAG TPA: CHASE3 domain-containing protein [Terracidiphilus sp.]|jgi:PAS domain S-box-containing protein